MLVPGFWLGPWAWDEVVPRLAGPGVEVLTPELPGHPAPAGPQDRADALHAALDPDADRRVLVLHSGAAVSGTLLIDQHPLLVDHVVWVDTAPVADGHALDADFSGEWYRLEDAWEEERQMGSFRDLTDEQLATFRERAIPEPGAVVATPVRLRDDRRHEVPSTLVCCQFGAQDYRAYAERGAPFLAALPDYRHLRLVDLPTGHWPMWSRPAELARLIAAAVG